MNLHLLRMRRNVNRNVFNDRKKRDSVTVRDVSKLNLAKKLDFLEVSLECI